MSVKVSVYIATSLDGLIARKNGEIDWLTGGQPGQDYGYADFISTIDYVVMGRNTYEKVLTFGGWPYEKRVIVLTSRDLTFPPDLTTRVEALNVSPQELMDELERRGVHHIYLDGGATIRRFLRETLVDEMTITTIPVLIGEGLPLFGPLERDIQLQLLTSNSFSNGFVKSKYKVR
jgi:dihydrofolate reductase